MKNPALLDQLHATVAVSLRDHPEEWTAMEEEWDTRHFQLYHPTTHIIVRCTFFGRHVWVLSPYRNARATSSNAYCIRQMWRARRKLFYDFEESKEKHRVVEIMRQLNSGEREKAKS